MSEKTRGNEPILLRQDMGEGIVALTLNRPDKRNALSSALIADVQAALDDIAADTAVKVVVLGGAGPAFSAGHDLNEVRTLPGFDETHELFQACSRMMRSVVQLPQPVIARIHGVATAAGCQLVASCDLAIASETARFGTPGVNIGLFCTTPSVAISRKIAPKHAMEMLLTGELIDAQTAYRFGLVNRVVPPEELDHTVMAFARAIAARSSETISIGKSAFYRQAELDMQHAYSYASEVMAKNMMGHDAPEGIDAFLQKRKPEWHGR